MRILQLNRWYPSGQTTHVDALSCALASQGHKVALAMLGLRDVDEARKLFTSPDPEALQLFARRGRVDLYNELHPWEPDVVHAHSLATWGLGADLAEGLGASLVVTAHGLGVDGVAQRQVLQKAAAAVCPGTLTVAMMRKIVPAHVQVELIGNAVDVDYFRPGPKPSRALVTYVGRLDPKRRAGFDAFASASSMVDADFCALGVAPGRPGADAVRCMGWVRSCRNELARADIVVGVGRALREGMACGAVGVVLGHHYHGPLTPERVRDAGAAEGVVAFGKLPRAEVSASTAATLATDLETLIGDQNRLRELQRYSRELATSRFDMRGCAAQHVELYRQVMH